MASRYLLPPVLRTVGGAFLALAVIGVQASEARTGTPARTLVVDDDGDIAIDCQPAAFATIGDALEAANPGDTILVCPGFYPEFESLSDVTILETVTLKGPQAGTPGAGRGLEIDTTTEAVVTARFTVQASNVVIDGFLFSTLGPGPLQPEAVLLTAAANDASVVNNVVDGVGPVLAQDTAGIHLTGGPDRVKLVNNRIRAIRSSGAAHGILIGDPTTPNPSKDILISGNLVERILGASAAYGIRVNNGAATQTGFTTVAIRDNIIGRPSINPFDRVSGLSANGIALDGPTPNVEVVRNSITSVEGTEINAVVFRDNRFFSTAEVHFNNFDVTSLGFGIKVDAALMNAWGKWGNVDGRCNWWGDPNGPSGGGRSSTGAQVSARVDFDPWLDAPAPGGKCFDPHDKCDKDDDDDHDHDGTRNDKDEDVDNDGLLNLLDLDDDNDGIADLVDADDDNDGIEDVYDDKSTRQVQRTLHHTLGAGGISEWMLASDGGALPLVSLIESPNAQFLRVEVYNPSGVLVGTSVPTPGVAVVTTSALLPGIYTVRVRNIGVAPIDYTTKLITTMAWY